MALLEDLNMYIRDPVRTSRAALYLCQAKSQTSLWSPTLDLQSAIALRAHTVNNLRLSAASYG